jgi:hypothetical protein
MKKLLLILIILSSSIFGQEKELYFKTFAPKYVNLGSTFEVSTVISFLDEKIDEAEFYILPKENSVLKSAVVNNNGKKFKLSIQKKSFGEFLDKSYLVSLKDSLMTFNSPFQIILKFSAKNEKEIDILFGLIYKMNGRRSAVYSSFEPEDSPYYIEELRVVPYKAQQIAGNALQIGKRGKINFIVQNDKWNQNLLVEFWTKFNSSNLKFFKVLGSEFSDTLLSLNYDDYQMIISDKIDKLTNFNENFFGLNNWNHFSIFISKEAQNATVYGNGINLFEIPLVIPQSDIELEFLNSTNKDFVIIDLLKVWSFENDIQKSFSNRHFISYQADSSSLLYNYSFDDDQVIENFESRNIDFSNLKLIKSDAPIYSRAPELNVKVYDKFFSIDWVSRDVVHAYKFVLEKSTDGRIFNEIFETVAEEDPKKIYFYSDEKNLEDEIIYYRLTQFNKDGSEVFSAPIKIGLGLKEIFALDQNYPNPFNPVTNITVEMFEAAEVEIYVYDIVGNNIQKLHTGSLSQGRHTFSFDGTELPSGIYFYEIKSPFSTLVRKMILAK